MPIWTMAICHMAKTPPRASTVRSKTAWQTRSDKTLWRTSASAATVEQRKARSHRNLSRCSDASSDRPLRFTTFTFDSLPPHCHHPCTNAPGQGTFMRKKRASRQRANASQKLTPLTPGKTSDLDTDPRQVSQTDQPRYAKIPCWANIRPKCSEAISWQLLGSDTLTTDKRP